MCWPSMLLSTLSACWGNTIFTQSKAKGSKFKGVENRLDKQCTWLHIYIYIYIYIYICHMISLKVP